MLSMLTLAFDIQTVKAESIETIIHEIIWQEQTFCVITVSNSSVTPVPMVFDQPQKMLTFNVTGPVGTTGFCDVTIPRELLDAIPEDWCGAWVVWINATHQSLRVTYSHPIKEVKIIGTWAIGTPPTVRTWTVDDDGPADFHTIQKAVNTAHDGDTIYVYNGTYREHVIVTKPLELLGKDKNTTVIDGGVSISQWISNVVISGFTIQNGDDGIDLTGWSFNHMISNNIITKNGYGIIGAYNCFGVTISNNIIISNHFSGIWLHFAHGIINGNIIANHDNDILSSGIDIVEGGNGNTITGNRKQPRRYMCDALH